MTTLVQTVATMRAAPTVEPASIQGAILVQAEQCQSARVEQQNRQTALGLPPPAPIRAKSPALIEPRALSLSPAPTVLSRADSAAADGRRMEVQETTHSPAEAKLLLPSLRSKLGPLPVATRLPLTSMNGANGPRHAYIPTTGAPPQNHAAAPQRQHAQHHQLLSSHLPHHHGQSHHHSAPREHSIRGNSADDRMQQRRLARPVPYALPPPTRQSEPPLSSPRRTISPKDNGVQEELQNRLESLAEELASIDDVVYKQSVIDHSAILESRLRDELENRRRIAAEAVNDLHQRCSMFDIAIWCPSQRSITVFQQHVEEDLANLQTEICDLEKRNKPSQHLTILRKKLLIQRYFWRTRLNLLD